MGTLFSCDYKNKRQDVIERTKSKLSQETRYEDVNANGSLSLST